jgi:hypothetical protein
MSLEGVQVVVSSIHLLTNLSIALDLLTQSSAVALAQVPERRSSAKNAEVLRFGSEVARKV